MPDDITVPLGRAFTATLNRLRQAMREPLADLPVALAPPDIRTSNRSSSPSVSATPKAVCAASAPTESGLSLIHI